MTAVQSCPICAASLQSLDPTARESHVNNCLDGVGGTSASPIAAQPATAAGKPEPAGSFSCAICLEDLTHLPLEARNQHVNRCCDALSEVPLNTSHALPPSKRHKSSTHLSMPVQTQLPIANQKQAGTQNNGNGSAGMRGAVYMCSSCGKDLSHANFTARVSHMKKCKPGGTESAAPIGQCDLPPAAMSPSSSRQWCLHDWLSGLGLSKYVGMLDSKLVLGRSSLADLTDASLMEMGVVALGARRKIIAAAKSAMDGEQKKPERLSRHSQDSACSSRTAQPQQPVPLHEAMPLKAPATRKQEAAQTALAVARSLSAGSSSASQGVGPSTISNTAIPEAWKAHAAGTFRSNAHCPEVPGVGKPGNGAIHAEQRTPPFALKSHVENDRLRRIETNMEASLWSGAAVPGQRWRSEHGRQSQAAHAPASQKSDRGSCWRDPIAGVQDGASVSVGRGSHRPSPAPGVPSPCHGPGVEGTREGALACSRCLHFGAVPLSSGTGQQGGPQQAPNGQPADSFLPTDKAEKAKLVRSLKEKLREAEAAVADLQQQLRDAEADLLWEAPL